MKINDDKLKAILVKQNYVVQGDIDKAKKFAKTYQSSIADYLISHGLITKDLLGQAMAESFKLPYADLNSVQPSKEQVLKMPEKIAQKMRVVIFAEEKGSLKITTDNPEQKELKVELKKVFPKYKISLNYSLPDDIDNVFLHYRKSLETRFSQIIKSNSRVAPDILAEIFKDAYNFHASDIHFEPQSKSVIVRFRIDGVLQEAGKLSKENYESVLNHIKVKSHLRIDEHYDSQDGSMRYQLPERTFDLRTSIVPTIEGEKIVLRVLAAYIQGFTLGDLGLSEKNQKIIEQAARKPFGMILVTGPTGSGKTTTLYAVLKKLNQPDVNITTIEDPVEYKIAGANQIQVNSRTNLSFAKGLRSIVRQDPDVILVGEIRDEETAEIAANAALTGHLLLSTFHANDASTAVPRLLDMNVEEFVLSSTLEVILAQRLIRKICENCRQSISVTPADLEKKFSGSKKYFKGKKILLYRGKGCNLCGDTGYAGRTALFELIKVTPEIQELILTNPSTQEIWKLARKQGASSLFEDGIEKVKNGDTTIDELLRIAPPPQD